MDYTVHALELHRDITVGGGVSDGTIALFEYRSLVGKNDLEPEPAKHLTDGRPLAEIRAGSYLFAQGSPLEWGFSAPPDAGLEARFRDASEAIWLESLWRELSLKNDRILVRILSEDSQTVFQVFREL